MRCSLLSLEAISSRSWCPHPHCSTLTPPPEHQDRQFKQLITVGDALVLQATFSGWNQAQAQLLMTQTTLHLLQYKSELKIRLLPFKGQNQGTMSQLIHKKLSFTLILPKITGLFVPMSYFSIIFLSLQFSVQHRNHHWR